MRKGARRDDWTVSDLETLRSMAGREPASAIAEALGRTQHAVEQVASLNGISLRRYMSRLSTCPSCGRLSATVNGRSGICRVCTKRTQLTTIQSRVAALLQQLPVEEREKYHRSEVRTGSRRDPPPPPPPAPGARASARQKVRAAEQREIDMEAWEVRNLDRRIKAAQKRKERIEKKLKSM